jgi:hypothetical protein
MSMKTTLRDIAIVALIAPAVIGLDLLAQGFADLIAPLGALPALVFFGALFTALIRHTK